MGPDRDLAFPVEQGQVFGGDSEGLQDHALWNAHHDSIGLAPPCHQQIPCLLVVHLDPDVFKHLEARPMDLFALLPAQP
jgi:hypothetical protein